MDNDLVKRNISNNIVINRKRLQLTQADLAQRLNYTDKAVSKWERAESVPDVTTLVQLSELFGITVNDLLAEPGSRPAAPESDAPVQAEPLQRSVNKTVIGWLSSILVWFIALLVFVVLSYCEVSGFWIGFVVAVPVNAVVLLSLNSAWRNYRWHRLLISFLMWGLLLTLFTVLAVYAKLCLPRIFLLGLPGQLAIVLWSRLYRPARSRKPREQDDP